jgi:aldehyde:ferredoxin oxidoreductase
MKAVWAVQAGMQDDPGRVAFTELGTAATIDLTQAFGGLPTRNFLQGQFEHYENLSGTTIKETRMVANKACFACTIACGRVTRLGEHSGKYLVNMHPRNWKSAGKASMKRLGARRLRRGRLDAVLGRTGCATTWGWTRSRWVPRWPPRGLYERGVITTQVELPLQFGSAEALVRWSRRRLSRGFGRIAEGSKRMGESSTRKCSWVKGQEFPA